MVDRSEVSCLCASKKWVRGRQLVSVDAEYATQGLKLHINTENGLMTTEITGEFQITV